MPLAPCEEIAADIAALSRGLCETEGIALSDVSRIGVATPGIVKEGVVLSTVNLGWQDAPLADDFAARLVIEDYIDALAVGVSNIINIFQPHVVCIGGGISREGDRLMKPLHDHVERMSFGLKQGKTRVEAAKFRNDAGIIGAALLGLQNF